MLTITNILGWIGAFLLLLAYFLLVHKNLTSKSKMYQIMNILGALLLATNTLTAKAYPALLVNIAWIIIGLYGLLHITNKKSKK